MIKPAVPRNEVERLYALRTLKILDSSHEERFDRITRMAKRMFNVSISLVSIIDEDRQWFKSTQGLELLETPRDISFCAHAINQDNLFIVPDASKDKRFFDNPLVTSGPKIRFYAGCPLKIRQGINIGTLCLIDTEPKHLNEEDQELLEDLGAIIEQEIKSIELATLDELTMISNRRGFLTLADHSLKVCRRNQMSMSFIFFDLNQFKIINDEHGHHEGDFVLATFAKIMLNSFRDCDLIARLGGDEFVAMLSDSDYYSGKANIALERFAGAIDQANKTLNKPYKIEYSAGVSYFKHDTDKSIEAMLKEADAAMYKQKKINAL
ncbi:MULTISPECIES: sensor domain-containing diguanylate cyclase [unclassified Colwellia]|uniref:sensor domain-containing diguanylate cyclase n=1 Tax=unclassified Colwellia TaxID=196834 RepID=UPI0015F6104A|nr:MULTISPECIES: sensor domain-containing diguanylate cyclase [unclassified Colwellia]MBA6287691.1 sensor domain-containing diguanylate cyclase [Colwellia sp. MB3u-4]MBA6295766.1 sensor domain-containing diguanylate cyclase [Colwellia sp. MB02u-9]